MFLAHLCGVPLTVLQLVSVIVAVVLATFAVPGAWRQHRTMVPALAVANLPLRGIGILLAVDAIPDMFPHDCQRHGLAHARRHSAE